MAARSSNPPPAWASNSLQALVLIFVVAVMAMLSDTFLRVDHLLKLIRTCIFKSPKNGTVQVSKLNLEGDKQSDLAVHGGVDKAVYAYPSEHYRFWQEEFPDLDLAWGAFGENFTTEGLLETAIHIGDSLQIGSAQFVVTQPRLPCFKLGIRLGRADMVNRFLRRLTAREIAS